MKMKSAMIISVNAKKESNGKRMHSNEISADSYFSDLEMTSNSFVEVHEDGDKAEVKKECDSDKLESIIETSLRKGSDSKKKMFRRESTRLKSKKMKNSVEKEVKESCDNNSRKKRTRKQAKISDSISETKHDNIDTKKTFISSDYSMNFIKDNLSFNSIAQKVIKAAAESKKMLGAHVSVAGGLEQSFYNALSIGCRSFAFFVRNQRSWNSPPMKDEVVRAFRETAQKLEFPMDQIVVHGSYLINGGSCDMEILNRAQACMLDECKRCEQLGIIYYNIHPGSTAGKCTREECIKTIADTLNYVMEHTEYITILIETMAGQGNTIGGKFEELQQIINLVKNKKRIGVCLDTCHIFAAGYDIRSEDRYNETFNKFDNSIGLQYLRAFHINDSFGDLGSKLDRHANIGKGKLKLAAFRHLIADPRFDGIPMILETPEGDYAEEMIRLYNSLNSKPLKEHKKDIRSFFSPV